MKLKNLAHNFSFSGEQLYMLALAVVVGLLGGWGAVGFRYLIGFFQKLSYGSSGNILEALAQCGWAYRLLVPTLGGVVVGPLIYFLAREAKGHGVPEVMDAVALKGGVIRKRIVAVKSLASAMSIAVGGSVGREGPIVQIGSAIGSSLGQMLKVSPNRMRVLVGCGAAAGIAATFNAPVAGMIFALEVVLGEFAITTFSPIVLAAVIATAVSRYHLGDTPAFIVPDYHIVSYYELGLYAGLGVLAGAVGVLFTTTLYKFEDAFDAWKIPDWIKPAVAGLGLGGLGLLFPYILGVGYEGMDLALAHKLSWWMMLALVGIKILATSWTIGGGMSGGIFAPSLFVGCMLGGAFGDMTHGLLPGLTAGAGAYAIVGMAALVAGTTHAPFSAFLILFEMTGGYKIILPLMIACIISTFVARLIRRESIYTLKLIRRGVDIRAGKELNILREMLVADTMSTQIESIPQNMSLKDFIDLVSRSKYASFPVVDQENHLVGIISHADYAEHAFDQDLQNLVVVKDMATRKVDTVLSGDNLATALDRISAKDYQTLPVIDSPQSRKLIGIISRGDIHSAYSRRILKSNIGK